MLYIPQSDAAKEAVAIVGPTAQLRKKGHLFRIYKGEKLMGQGTDWVDALRDTETRLLSKWLEKNRLNVVKCGLLLEGCQHFVVTRVAGAGLERRSETFRSFRELCLWWRARRNDDAPLPVEQEIPAGVSFEILR